MIYLIISILIIVFPIAVFGVPWKNVLGACMSNKSTEIIKLTYGIHPSSAKFILVIVSLFFIGVMIRLIYKYITKIESDTKIKIDNNEKDKE